MGLRVVGIVPCTCQCWHGPKAPKLSTIGSNARANAVPYVINTNTAPSCEECKRKLDQEQQIQMQQHHINCAFNAQQSQQHQHLPHCLSMQCSSLMNPSNATTTNNQLYNVPPPSMIPSILPAVLQTGQNANVSQKFLLTSANTAASNAVLTTVPFGMQGFMAPTLTNANGSLTLLPSNQIPPGNQNCLPNAIASTMQSKNSTTHDTLTMKSIKESALTKKVPTLRSTAAAALTAQKKVNKINLKENT
uniref:Uncharacterized protein n=1 Tax=Glossina brevipalpis TaxID=37001 RepID=A0A1A9X4Q1_9MUSC